MFGDRRIGNLSTQKEHEKIFRLSETQDSIDRRAISPGGQCSFIQLAQPVSLGENKACLAAKLRDIHAAAFRYGALELVDAAAKLVLRVLYRVGAHGIAEAELLGELVKLRFDGRITVDGEICDLRLKRAHDGYLLLGICVLLGDLLAHAVRAYKAN